MVTKKKAVVLLSGGLDSSVTLARALKDGYSCYALTIAYGQRHRVELEAAGRVAEALGVADHKVLSLDLTLFGGSALTDSIDVPKAADLEDTSSIPVTYVPARNTIFLSIALGWAEVLGAWDIFIGVSSVDYSGYPDCRPEFIEEFERLARLGTKAADGTERFRVHTPLIRLSKADTVLLGRELGLDFSLTHSCYDPAVDGAPCGSCDSCRFRAKGFKEAGFPDPLVGGRGK